MADHMQARLRHEAVWIRPENIYAGKMGSAIAGLLEERHLDRGTIGVVGLEPYPPFYFDGAIQARHRAEVVEYRVEQHAATLEAEKSQVVTRQ